MNYGLQQTVAPASEPVSLADLKLHCRVDINDDDTVITALGIAAREYVETVANRQIMPATYVMGIDLFPYGSPDIRYIWNRFGVIKLPKSPCISVTSIIYTDSGGNVTTLDPSLYQVDVLREPARIAPVYTQVWPIVQYTTFNTVRVTFVSGYANPPASYGLAIKLLTAHLYENREASSETALTPIPLGLKAFIATLSPGEYA